MIEREHRAVFTGQLHERRRRGRPRGAVLKVPTTIRLPEDVYAALCRLVQVERRASLHDLMCDTLISRARQASTSR
jgi:hypothetical protein